MDASLPDSTAPAHPCSTHRAVSEQGREEIQRKEREDHTPSREPLTHPLYLGSLLEIPGNVLFLISLIEKGFLGNSLAVQ